MLFFTWLLCLYRTIYGACGREGGCKIALEVQSIIYATFLLFVIFAANPFAKNLPTITDGLGLNPLLQDMAFAIHPPILYIGYVGTSVIFALAIAYCYKPYDNIAAVMRPWILLSWSFLTLGIGLGAWWAYRELGWGGFWFWDPVENISLLPWLLTLTLIHTTSLAKRQASINCWLVLLGIITFIISILGTFITRSGLLNSVHSFADNPEQSYYMLIVMIFITIGSIVSYGIFCKTQQKSSHHSFSACENFLLLNNFFLITSAAAIFIGVIYPIFSPTLIITPTYYNDILKKILLPFLCIWIIGPQLSANQKPFILNILAISLAFIVTVILSAQNFLLFFLTYWLIFILLISYLQKIQLGSLSIIKTIRQTYQLPKSYYAMLLAHLGGAIIALGILLFSQFSLEKEEYMQLNDTMHINRYNLKLEKVALQEKDNYHALIGTFQINGSFYLTPEIRFYGAEEQSTAEVAIHRNFLSDLYIVMSEFDEKLGLGVQVHYNAYVNLIWIGVIIMFIGGIIGLIHSIKKSKIVT